MTTIGFIGAGKIGSAVARLAITAGYDVVLSNSRGPETLVDLVAELGDRARAGTSFQAAEAADIAVVSIPLKNYRDVPVEPLAGKVVIDTNNYYWQRDGHIPELDAAQTTSAGLLQAHLPTSQVVKAFNHITFSDLASQPAPAGTTGRRALAIAGDDDGARSAVAVLLDRFGFDVVDVGRLDEGWRFQPGTPAYGAQADAAALDEVLAAAKRPAAIS